MTVDNFGKHYTDDVYIIDNGIKTMMIMIVIFSGEIPESVNIEEANDIEFDMSANAELGDNDNDQSESDDSSSEVEEEEEESDEEADSDESEKEDDNHFVKAPVHYDNWNKKDRRDPKKKNSSKFINRL